MSSVAKLCLDDQEIELPTMVGSEGELGVTVIVASGPAATMTVARPEKLPLVAWTVLVNVPGVVPAVKRPELLIVPPEPALHTGVMTTTLPLASLPTAVNC